MYDFHGKLKVVTFKTSRFLYSYLVQGNKIHSSELGRAWRTNKLEFLRLANEVFRILSCPSEVVGLGGSLNTKVDKGIAPK